MKSNRAVLAFLVVSLVCTARQAAGQVTKEDIEQRRESLRKSLDEVRQRYAANKNVEIKITAPEEAERGKKFAFKVRITTPDRKYFDGKRMKVTVQSFSATGPGVIEKDFLVDLHDGTGPQTPTDINCTYTPVKAADYVISIAILDLDTKSRVYDSGILFTVKEQSK